MPPKVAPQRSKEKTQHLTADERPILRRHRLERPRTEEALPADNLINKQE